MNKEYIAPWVRTGILLVSTIIIFSLSYTITGSIIPIDARDTLIFQNALLLIVISIALLEKYYTKPADSMVNSLIGLMTMIGVYKLTPALAWWVIFVYVSIVFLFSTISTAIFSFDIQNLKLLKLASITYGPAVLLGQARVLYSVLFLFAVFTFKGIQSPQTVELVIFWSIFIVIWPLKLPQLISRISSAKTKNKPVGYVMRTDWPNIVRIVVQPGNDWNNNSIKIFQQAGGNQNLVLPLYCEPQGEQMVGTGLVMKELSEKIPRLDNGFMYEVNQDITITDAEISEALGGGSQSKLVGFIVEESTISEVKFEIWDPNACWEGMLVWCEIGDVHVYYQVTNGCTKEEVYQSNRHGFQLGSATQLGVLDKNLGFQKFSWVPRMNTPVFAESTSFGEGILMTQEGDFIYGCIPGTKLNIGGPFVKNMDHHTAILGVTGSGKTELAFELIRNAINQGIKVICIDLTAKYESRLNDLNPKNLSLSTANILDLNKKLFDVETGKYGAGDEKKALQQYSDKIREDVQKAIQDFLTISDENNKLWGKLGFNI